MRANRSLYYSDFVPTVIPNCALWLDAADACSFVFSGSLGVLSNVARWRDKSAFGNDASAVGIPFWQSNSLNGEGGVLFTGVQNFVGTAPTNTERTLTGFIVADISVNAVAWGRLVSLGGDGVNDSSTSTVRTPLFHRFSTTPTLLTWRNNLSLGAVPITYGVPFIATSVFEAASHRMLRDGGAASQNGTTGGNFGYTNYGIGKNNGTDTARHVGKIHEVILYNHAVGSNERQVIEGYLAEKWGLRSLMPSNHPYATIKPFARPFIPTDLPNCRVWLDAADISTMDLSAAGTPTIVARWYDKSGNSNNWTTYTNAITYEGPSYISNAALFFSNANDNNKSQGDDGLSNVNALPGSGPNLGVYCTLCNTSSLTRILNDAYQIRQITTGTLVEHHLDVTDTNGPFTASATAVNSLGARVSSCNANVVYGTFFGSNYTDARRNGHPFRGPRGATNTNTTVYGFNTFTIAGHIDNRQFTGSVRELIMYDTIDSSYAYIPRIEQYLARKYDTWADLCGNNPYRFFPALVPAFNPLAMGVSNAFITSNTACTLWYDGADPATVINSSGLVSAWLDKSGNKRHATQATSLSQALYVSNQYLNFLALSTNFMDICDAATALVNTSFTIFAVEQRTTGGAAANMFLGGSSTTAAANLALGQGADATFSFRMNTNYNVTVPTYATDTNIRVWSLTHNAATNRTLARNGSNFTAGAAATNLSSYAGAALGRYTATTGTTTYYNGNLYEMIWYSGVLPSNERYMVEGYLAHKWNRDLSFGRLHPYQKTTP